MCVAYKSRDILTSCTFWLYFFFQVFAFCFVFFIGLSKKIWHLNFLFWQNHILTVIYFGLQVILMILAANATVGVITETNAEKALEVSC